MRFLVAGLGSMGSRRIRNLQALGCPDIIGYDPKEERRRDAEARYGICTVPALDALDGYDAMIVSTPPDRHVEYMMRSVRDGKPCFVELGLTADGLGPVLEAAGDKGVLIAPSSTFVFHPAVEVITGLVRSGAYGRVLNFTYHSGQYLPDWHPWEDPREFFAFRKETSGCREIISFELHWLAEVLGMPDRLGAGHRKTSDLGIDFDDTYAVCIHCGGVFGLLFVDVVSRFATRSLIMNLEGGQIRWNLEDGFVRVYEAGGGAWLHLPEHDRGQGNVAMRNTREEMYVDELRAFIAAAEGRAAFPNTLEQEIRLLRLIDDIMG